MPSPRFGRLGRALLAVLLVAGAAEVGLRVAGRLYLRKLYAAGETRPGDIPVVCLGESSTAGLWVEPRDSYPGQLQEALRRLYGEPRIRVVVPPHVGQNTSQMANRIHEYLELYKPRLLVVMAGYNNEWSLAESHVGSFLRGSDAESLRVRLLVALDNLRLFKVTRYACLKLVGNDRSGYMARNVLGHPELVRYPPEEAVYSFAKANRGAFVALWKHDVGAIVHAAGVAHVNALLMTYHVNPTYLTAEEIVSFARAEGVPLARNDLSFEPASIDRFVFADDHWHPNRLGYAIIAGNALRAIAENDLVGLGRRTLPPPAPPAPTLLTAGRTLPLGSHEAAEYLGRGWSRPEGSFRWTDGPTAEIVFAAEPSGGARLRMRLTPFGRQRLEIRLNGERLDVLELTAAGEIEVPARGLARENVLGLALPDARSPSSLGQSADTRTLGVSVEWIRLDGVPGSAP